MTVWLCVHLGKQWAHVFHSRRLPTWFIVSGVYSCPWDKPHIQWIATTHTQQPVYTRLSLQLPIMNRGGAHMAYLLRANDCKWLPTEGCHYLKCSHLGTRWEEDSIQNKGGGIPKRNGVTITPYIVYKTVVK